MQHTTDLIVAVGGTGPSMLGATVFSVGEDRYTWEDVILASVQRGDWAEVETATRQGLGCLRRASHEVSPADPGRIDRAAATFRYERGLVTAEAMWRWLSGWALTVREWMDWVEGDVLRRQWADSLALTAIRYPVAPGQVAAAVWTEAVCSGALARFASELARRAAAAVAARELPLAATRERQDWTWDGTGAISRLVTWEFPR